MNDSRRVLITGSTGFIGYEVARQLCAQGIVPRLMVRRPLRATILSSLQAELVQADLTSPASLHRAVQGVDTIIHLGGRAIFEEYELVRPTIVDGSVALMKAAVDVGAKRFVYASSLLVYADQDQPIDERTPAHPRLGYGRAKLQAEQLLAEMAAKAGVDLAVIRLPHVYGARDLLFNQIRHGRVVIPGNGRNRFAHLHVADAARVLLAVAQRGWRGTSPVADDLAVDWNQFFGVVKEYYPRLRYLGVPRWMALLGTRLWTPIRRLSRYPSLHTPDAVLGWNLNVPVKSGMLWEDLQLAPLYPSIHQGIPAVLDASIEFRWLHPIADRTG